MTLTASVLYHFTSSALAAWLAWRWTQATGWPAWASSTGGPTRWTHFSRLALSLSCAVCMHIVVDVPEHGWTLPTLLQGLV